MKRIVYILLILPLLWQCTPKNEVVNDGYATLELRLKGKKYDSLFLRPHLQTYTDTGDKEPLKISGLSDDGYNWTFQIPDSIQKYYDSYEVKMKLFDPVKKEDYRLIFSTKEVVRRMTMSAIRLEDKKTIIEGAYVATRIDTLDQNWAILVDGHKLDSLMITEDLFYLEIPNKETYTENELPFVYPDFGVLPEDNSEEKLEEYIAIASKYPNSESLIERIGPARGYRSKEDMKRLYRTFSKELRDKHKGYPPYVDEYLAAPAKFVDIGTLELVNSKTGKLEQVIMDKSKPTLVLFSAFGYERREQLVLFLKELYKEKARNLDIVFINVDKDTEDKWETLMKEEQMPWRSLHARDHQYALSDTYQYWGVETGVLADGKELKIFPYNNERLKKIVNNY